MKARVLSRRDMLSRAIKLGGGVGALAALSACAAATPQVVEKEVTRVVEASPQVVKETVVVEAVVTPAPVAAGTGQVYLRWLTDHYGGTRGQISDEAIATWKERYPEVEIVYEPVPEVAERLMVELAAGKAPDIMLFSDDLMIPYGDMVLDLTDMYEADPDIAREDYMAVPALFLKDDKDWCVPYQGNVQGMWINEDYFKQAGAKMPWEYDHDGDKWWDWNDFLETVKAVRELPPKNGQEIYGVEVTNRFEWGYLSWVLSNGGNYADVEKGVSLFSSEPTKEAMKYIIDLFCEYDVAIPFEQIQVTRTSLSVYPFIAGLAGCGEHTNEGSVTASGLNAYRVAFPRSPRTKEAHTGLNNQPHVVARATAFPKEAFEFIKYMGSREIQGRAAELGAFDPCRLDIYDDPDYYTEWPAVSKEAKLEQIHNGGYRPMFNSFWEWTNEFHSIMEEATACELGFDETIAELDQVTNDVLAVHG